MGLFKFGKGTDINEKLQQIRSSGNGKEIKVLLGAFDAGSI